MKTLPQINHSINKNIGSSNSCTSNKPTEIVILDPTIPDSQQIAQGIKPHTATYILKNQPDAVEQITTVLAQHTGIAALHIITHGDSGSLYLGTTELNSSNIQNYSYQFQQWRNSLTDNANIILYGCNVAAGDRGNQFLTQLHQLTGANISANSQPTGNSALGGSWDIPQLIPPSSKAPQLALTETTLNNYSGVLGFATQVTFPTGNGPISVSIGDFNGDLKPDLAVANNSGSSASILLNTTPTGATTPTFATQVDFPTGTNPISVSIGDFNGDLKPDLAVANNSGSSASILLNTTATGATTPTFANQVEFPTGFRPFSLSIGDINGDGKPDLAVANNSGSSASILLNTTPTGAATPTFSPQVTFPTGNGPISVSIGDFNGDLKPDLAVMNRDSNTTSILLNTTPTGATTPTFAAKVDFFTGAFPYSVSIGDINGDGKPDLAVANAGSSSASILLNTTPTGATTPTFAAKVDFFTGFTPTSVSIGDINGDLKPDLAVANLNSNTASILLNTTPTGAATPTFAPQVTFPTGAIPFSVSIGDINGDGKPDLAVANANSNDVSILLNTNPKVTAVTATTPDGSYGVGSTIAITVTFDAAVNVTGTPRLQLETGTTDQFATYASGSGGTALTFNYLVQAGDTSLDLQYLATTALTLNGGTIKDSLTADADLTLPTLATANSLGGSKAIVIDTVAPTVALTSTSPTTTNAPFLVTATFSETVTGFIDTDVTVANGTVSGFTGTGTTYSFTVTPTATGNVTVDIPAATATDTAGNNNTAAAQLIRTADITPPTVVLTSASPTTTNAPFLVTATFSETVTGFIDTDVTVGNGTVSGFTGTGTTYSFTVTPTATGAVTVDIPAATATDTVGNSNTAAIQLTRTADITPPNVTLTSASPANTNAPFLVTATFSETVTGFIDTDVTVANGTVSGFTGTGTTYNFIVTPTATGNVTVDIPAATAIDTIGNSNTAAAQLTRTADITAPTVTLTSASPTNTNAPFLVTATFSETVTGFIDTDVTVANGTVSGFTGTGTTYNFTVTPTATGNVTVDIPAATAIDTIGNSNTAAAQLTRTADITAPT
ncbi:FG-GAP-like repeat-containing protein, partial [Microcoleus sp. EPA2]|uniref:FG-GAP-like repeat-containing protein n=1 Tax=Microcoleus sp. EPA2 TaxID=2841654 RepID=UPI00312BCB5D